MGMSATGEVGKTVGSGEVGAQEGAGTDVGTIEDRVGVVLVPSAWQGFKRSTDTVYGRLFLRILNVLSPLSRT